MLARMLVLYYYEGGLAYHEEQLKGERSSVPAREFPAKSGSSPGPPARRGLDRHRQL